MKKLVYILFLLFALTQHKSQAQSCFADFAYNSSGLTVSFIDSSTVTSGNITSYNWDFGDGSFSTLSNPTHSYSQSGAFVVCLDITASTGCRNFFCDTVLVSAPPCQASFTYTSDSLNTVYFSNTSNPISGYTFLWNFGDGSQTVNAINPTHIYSSPSPYVVTLTASGAPGISCSVSDTIYANYCDAFFVHQQQGQGSVNFFGYPSSSDASAYSWDFGDGSPSTFQKNASHTYNASGIYTVTFTLFDTLTNLICSYTDSVAISITPPCQAGFNANVSQNTLSIQNTASNFSSVLYDFGDGTGTSQANPTHIYAQSGTYQVCQIVTNSSTSCVDSTCQTITIVIPPSCQAGFNATVNQDTLFIQNTASNFSHISYDFGDGTGSNQTSPIHVYTQSGTYQICQTIVDSTSNCVDSVCQTISISVPAPCHADFTYSTIRRSILIQDQASNYTSISYDFGDGATSMQANPSHTYLSNGNYTVCQTVSNSNGCLDVFCDTISISVPVCNAGFSSSISIDSAHFTNNAVNYTSLLYDFGDGDTSSVENPTHIYTASGTYVVCQTVADPLNNCSSTFCDTLIIVVPPPCRAGFQYTENNGTVNFQNTAVNYTSLSYDFGDGNVSNQSDPIHTYAQSGTYIVTQTVGDGTRCNDLFIDTLEVMIIPPCNAGFSYSYVGDSVLFQNTASSFNRLIYYFGDGDSSLLENPYHAYQQSGTYTVKQLVFNDSTGCVDSLIDSVTVTVSRSCVAKYVVAIDTNQRGTLFLVNTSTDDNTHHYFWDFGDGNTATGRTPTHQYSSNQKFNICLTVSDSVQNCSSTYCDSTGLDTNGNVLKTSGFLLKVINGTFIGIEENNSLEELSVYPNPVSHKIIIENQVSLTSIDFVLLTIDGKEVKKGRLEQVKEEIEVSHLKNGMYFLRLYDRNNSVIKRIIKQ